MLGIVEPPRADLPLCNVSMRDSGSESIFPNNQSNICTITDDEINISSHTKRVRKKSYIIIPNLGSFNGTVENENGLSSEEARCRLQKFGMNMSRGSKTPIWWQFVKQLWEPMPIMIWVAAVVEGALGNYVDLAILIFILFGNASLRVYELMRAESAADALAETLVKTSQVTVKRDGSFVEVDEAQIVPGDVVVLCRKYLIPADCRVITGEVDIDESPISGESVPVTKFKGGLCHKGCTVVRGEVEALVLATGINTTTGKTAKVLEVCHSNQFKYFLVILFYVCCCVVLSGLVG
jgi:magnesium-transporting ATPase (P-type)